MFYTCCAAKIPYTRKLIDLHFPRRTYVCIRSWHKHLPWSSGSRRSCLWNCICASHKTRRCFVESPQGHIASQCYGTREQNQSCSARRGDPYPSRGSGRAQQSFPYTTGCTSCSWLLWNARAVGTDVDVSVDVSSASTVTAPEENAEAAGDTLGPCRSNSASFKAALKAKMNTPNNKYKLLAITTSMCTRYLRNRRLSAKCQFTVYSLQLMASRSSFCLGGIV